MGLGLSISERIAAILNHPIALNSVPGKGSVFHLMIKLTDTNTNTTSIQKDSSYLTTSILEGKKILCVDNEQQIIDAMTMLLTRWGCEVQSARNEEHTESIFNSGFIPEIMLVDYHLDHNKTGLEFIQQFRQKTGIKIPAVVITADQSSEVDNEIRQAGLKVLHKPVKPAVLRATINNELGDFNSK